MGNKYAVKLAPGAIEDIKEAIEWYESRLSAGLSSRFIKQLDESLIRLAMIPEKGSVRYDNIRCTLVKKFPYMIHYEINNDTKCIIVYRIFCTFRKPLWE